MVDDTSEIGSILSQINEEHFLLQEENRVLKEQEAKSSQKIKELTKLIVEQSAAPQINPQDEENEKLREYEMRNVILVTENDQLHRKNEVLEVKLKANMEYIVNLRLTHHDLEELAKERLKEVELMKSKAELHASTTLAADKKIQALQNEFSRVAQYVETQEKCETKEAHKKFKTQILEYKEVVSKARKQMITAGEQIRNLKKENKELSEQLQKKTSECKLALTEHSSTVDKFKALQIKLQDERISFLKTIDQSQATMREQAVYTNRLEQTIAEIKEERDKLMNELKGVEKKHKEQVDELRGILLRTESSVAEAQENNAIMKHKMDLDLADKDAAVEFARRELNACQERERVELEKSLALSLKLTQNEVKLSNSELEINLQKQELQFSKDKISQLESELAQQIQLYHKAINCFQEESTSNDPKKDSNSKSLIPISSNRLGSESPLQSNSSVTTSSGNVRTTLSQFFPSMSSGLKSPELQYSVTIDEDEESGLLDLGLDDEVELNPKSKPTTHAKSLPHSQHPPQFRSKLSHSHLELQPSSLALVPSSSSNSLISHSSTQPNSKNSARSTKPITKTHPPKGTLVILGDKNASNQKCAHCKGQAYGYMIPCTQCSKLFHKHCIPLDAKNLDAFVCEKCNKETSTQPAKRRRTKN